LLPSSITALRQAVKGAGQDVENGASEAVEHGADKQSSSKSDAIVTDEAAGNETKKHKKHKKHRHTDGEAESEKHETDGIESKKKKKKKEKHHHHHHASEEASNEESRTAEDGGEKKKKKKKKKHHDSEVECGKCHGLADFFDSTPHRQQRPNSFSLIPSSRSRGKARSS
jgi:hypothetical protein